MNVVSWKAAEPLIAQSCHAVQVRGNLPRCQEDRQVLMPRTAQTNGKGCRSGLYERSQMVHLTVGTSRLRLFHCGVTAHDLIKTILD